MSNCYLGKDLVRGVVGGGRWGAIPLLCGSLKPKAMGPCTGIRAHTRVELSVSLDENGEFYFIFKIDKCIPDQNKK